LHNIKVENYVLFDELAEDLSPEDSLSFSSEGLLQSSKEEPGVSATKTRE